MVAMAKYAPRNLRATAPTATERRADIDAALTAKGHEEGHVGGRNSWPIDMLQNGDVYVANAFGSYEGGPIIGGNLSTAIFKNSGNGVVFDGSVRDIAQMETIEAARRDELVAEYRRHNWDVHDELIAEYPGTEEVLEELETMKLGGYEIIFEIDEIKQIRSRIERSRGRNWQVLLGKKEYT